MSLRFTRSSVSGGSNKYTDLLVRNAGSTYRYHHHCSVVVSDVLKHDIPGDKMQARLKRWWWDLFLGPSEDHHLFYNSSYGLRMQRLWHFRRHKNMIHPFSKFRLLWDCLILHLLVLYDFLFHLTTSVYFGDLARAPYYINASIEILRIIDVILNLHTGYTDKMTKRVELDTMKVILYYCSTKLFLHVIGSIPLTWLIFLRYGSNFDCSLCKTNHFIAVLKVLNIFNLIRVYQCSEYWLNKAKIASSYWSQVFKLVRIFVLGLLTMLQFRELSDIGIFQVMAASGEIARSSRFGKGVFLRHVVLRNHTSWSFNYRFFIYDISRFVKCFFLYSFNPRIEHNLDRMVSVVGVLIIKSFFMWTLAECYCFIVTKMYVNDKIILTERMATNMLRSFQLPDALNTKIYKYFDYKMAAIKLVDDTKSFLKALPKVLRDEAFTEFYSRYLSKISYFTNWPDDIIVDLGLLLKDCIYQIGDIVAEPWLQAEGLVIVAHGELAVYNDDLETGHLIDGDYFGELSLVTDREIRISSIVSLSPSLVLILNKSLFRNYMKQYPALFLAFKEDLNNKFRDKIVMSTQQFDSERTASMTFGRFNSI